MGSGFIASLDLMFNGFIAFKFCFSFSAANVIVLLSFRCAARKGIVINLIYNELGPLFCSPCSARPHNILLIYGESNYLMHYLFSPFYKLRIWGAVYVLNRIKNKYNMLAAITGTFRENGAIAHNGILHEHHIGIMQFNGTKLKNRVENVNIKYDSSLCMKKT